MTYAPTTNNPNNYWGMVTCFATPSTGVVGGVTYPGAHYIRWDLKSIVPATPPWLLPGNQTWPTLWEEGMYNVGVAGGPADVPEIDEAEYSTVAGGDATTHIWPNGNGTGRTQNFGTPGVPTNLIVSAIVVPPEANGGTGYVKGFLNDTTALTPTNTWTLPEPSGQHFDVLPRQPYCAMVSASGGPGGSTAVTINSVQVFVPSSAILPSPSGGLRRPFRH
jgi:hypothetical protein